MQEVIDKLKENGVYFDGRVYHYKNLNPYQLIKLTLDIDIAQYYDWDKLFIKFLRILKYELYSKNNENIKEFIVIGLDNHSYDACRMLCYQLKIPEDLILDMLFATLKFLLNQ